MTASIDITKIVSGGQTGVDRGALDAAIYLQISHGGWCPRGRISEDGSIPQQYLLAETPSSKYPFRTERNVVDSDATLILHFQTMGGGTKLTQRMASKHRRPLFCVDLADDPDTKPVRSWISENAIRVLNVAGPRESSVPGIGDLARGFMLKLLETNT